MAWTGWVQVGDLDSFSDVWADGVTLSEGTAELLLTSAWEQCEAYAPAAPDGEDVAVSDRFRLAQVMQARALWRSGMAGSGDQLGGGDLAVTVFPMDWTVKRLLRPQRGRPVVA